VSACPPVKVRDRWRETAGGLYLRPDCVLGWHPRSDKIPPSL